MAAVPAPAGRRPGIAGYLAGVGVMVAGIVIGIVLLVSGVASVAHLLVFPQQVEADGGITIDHAGPYIVYLIRPAPGTSSSPPIKPGVSVTGPDGSAVPTGIYGVGRSTGSGQYQASAVATFTAHATGTYHVTAVSLQPGESLGVGDGRKVQTGAIAWGFVVGGLGFLIGLVLIIVTAARRHRAKPYPMVPPGYPGTGYPMGLPGYPPQGSSPWQPLPAQPPSTQEWWKQDPQQGPPS